MNRRQFLATTSSSLLASQSLFSRQSRAADARIDILLNEPGLTIAPEIYGHFVEHIGGNVYDGIWVGDQQTAIPHVNGLRKELVDALRKVKPGMIRWPGGCFADQYDWRDGIGPRNKRPRRTNFWVDAQEWPANANRRGPQVYDPNTFGTLEFARFCDLVGAQPYFAANLRSLPAEQLYQWIEYCNSPAGSTTLADQRAADGHPEPLNVKYWGVGNESWGCGGNFDPEDYASEFRRYSAWNPSYGLKLAAIGSGPPDDNFAWTRRVFAKLGPDGINSMSGWAMHHYSWNASSHPHAEWYKAKSDALKFDTAQYYSLLRDANDMDRLISAHWDIMAEFDPAHKVKLVVDEWGAWHSPGTEPFAEALLGQQCTIGDAVIAGITLDCFNRHADKVGMASIAQLANNLQCLFFAHENRFCLTPTYHVFAMYAAHQSGQSIRSVISTPDIHYTWDDKPATMPGLSSSSSLKGNILTLTVTNPSIDTPKTSEIAIRGGHVLNISATVLAAANVHAHNSFDNPRSVEPSTNALTVSAAVFQHTFPPASVTKFEVTIG
jgi:alpha-N-arabinofuranosidase